MTASLPEGLARPRGPSRAPTGQRATGTEAPSGTKTAAAAGLPGGALLPPATRPDTNVAPPDADAGAGLTARSTSRSEHSRAGARVRSAWVVPAIALIALIPLIVGSRREDASTATQPIDSGLVAAAPRALAPIVLPAPGGNAVRVRPLDFVLVVDPADAQHPSLEADLAAAIEHIARWSMPGDLIGAGTALEPLVPVAAATPAALETTLRPTGMRDPAVQVRSALARFADPTHDHALVVLTSTPGAWLEAVPAAPAPDPAVGAMERPAQLRSYVIDITSRPGTRPVTPTSPQGPTPLQLAADPGTRGAIAEATAKAWVDAIGSIWAGGS